MLSRVSWPVFPTSQVIESLDRSFKRGSTRRVCLQALNYPRVFKHLTAIAEEVEAIPISVSCQPLNPVNLKRLVEAGVERLGIPLDAATEEIFEKVKGSLVSGPYVWEEQFRILREAVEVLGKNMVSTHLIVGLGETENGMVETIQRCVDMGVLPALFAFTPIPGTSLENKSPPSIPVYRRIQIARHLIFNGITRYEDVSFDEEGRIRDFDDVEKEVLSQIIQSGKPFLTTGCPDCNRPYYNEKPRGPIYNYPRLLTEKEKKNFTRNIPLLT